MLLCGESSRIAKLVALLLAALAEGVLLALVVRLELLGVRVGDGLDLLELQHGERIGSSDGALLKDHLVRVRDRDRDRNRDRVWVRVGLLLNDHLARVGVGVRVRVRVKGRV